LIAAIGLHKPFAKTEVGKPCTVGCLLTQGSDDNSYRIKIPVIHFQYQHKEQQLNNNFNNRHELTDETVEQGIFK
jgi:hypothetical protein